MKNRIAILGSGITGVTLAKQIIDTTNSEVTLFDQYDRVGGNHISQNIDGYTFDIGTFIFFKNGAFFSCFPDLPELYVKKAPVFGRIEPLKNLNAYPFSIPEYYTQSSKLSFMLDVADLLLSKFLYFNKKDVPGFVKYYLGGRIYRKSGLKNYIERFYGIPDHEIDLEFAKKRMEDISNSASFRKKISKILRPGLAGVPDQVLIRPYEGFGKIYDKLQKELETKGVTFRLNTKITKIEKRDGKFLIGCDRMEMFDRVITTIPINETLDLIRAHHSFKLPSQTLISLFIKLDGTLNFDKDVLYNFMDDGCWKRLTVYSRLYGKINAHEYFTVEVISDPWENTALQDIYRRTIKHLEENKLFSGIPTMIGNHILENAYPLYAKKNKKEIYEAKNTLKNFGVEMAGRQGNFDYIPSADIAAKKIKEFLK